MSDLLTIHEAAERLRLHENTIRRMLAELGAVNVGKPGAGRRTLRIPAENIDKFLRMGTVREAVALRARTAENWRIPRRRGAM